MGYLIGLFIGILFIYLEYTALYHFATESKLPDESKKAWILAFVLLGGLASIIYLLTEYKKNKKEQG